MEGTLTISPAEQVELLAALYSNRFGFSPENIDSVKNSICLFSSSLPGDASSESKNFYGKTGTGRIDGQDVNGWFVGLLEEGGNTFFFATNTQNDSAASGSRAAKITKAILSDLNLWK